MLVMLQCDCRVLPVRSNAVGYLPNNFPSSLDGLKTYTHTHTHARARATHTHTRHAVFDAGVGTYQLVLSWRL